MLTFFQIPLDLFMKKNTIVLVGDRVRVEPGRLGVNRWDGKLGTVTGVEVMSMYRHDVDPPTRASVKMDEVTWVAQDSVFPTGVLTVVRER